MYLYPCFASPGSVKCFSAGRFIPTIFLVDFLASNAGVFDERALDNFVGVHGMRQGLLQPTEKIEGILWRPYVPRGTKKLAKLS